MEEKTMVNDILGNVKADLTAYQTAISESENIQLRQTFQQIRNNDESFQYELFKVANAKGYYKPAQKATVTEIETVKTELQHLRHLIGAHENVYQKLNTYSAQSVDPQIKQLFTKSAQDALNTKQKLMSFLNN